jgi:hypothetical protein
MTTWKKTLIISFSLALLPLPAAPGWEGGWWGSSTPTGCYTKELFFIFL